MSCEEDNEMVNQSVRSTSIVPTVVSVIALVVSGIALVCVLLLLIISKVRTGQGGSATAITNSAAMSVVGMVFFTAFTWIFAILGGFIGLIMLVVDIAVKRGSILWMPITAIVLGVISMLLSILAF